ncbi:MAG: LysR family transcriptional regulator [Roseovarius sp.]
MVMALTLAHLQMLVAIRDTGSMNAAANRLGVTQSALTHRLREAERRLNLTLFSRVGRTLRPSAAADILTEAADQLLDRLALAERAAAASSQGVRHIVRLTVCDYNSYHWLPGFLAGFGAQSPDIEIEIDPGSRHSALRRLTEGQLDIALLAAARDAPETDAIPLFEDRLATIVWPGHPMSHKPFAHASDFDTETYLTYSLEFIPGFESDRLWSAEGAMPLRKRNLGSVDAVCELIRAEAGVSILSRWGLTRELEAGTLVAIEAGAEGIPIGWYARLAPNTAAHAPAMRVARALQEWFRELPVSG